MRGRNAAVICLLWGASALAPAALLWDNFISTSPGGFDGLSYVSSELDATLPNGSFAADDATFSSPVTVQKIRWAGCNWPQYTYTPEVVILRSDYSTVADYTPATYSVLGTFGQVFAGYTAYNAEVTIPDTVLTAGHYYFGVRLINRNGQTPGPGRNMYLTTGNGTIQGSNMAIVKVPDFGYPNWTPINQFYGAAPTDLPFQLYGLTVPEPTALSALALGALALLRRRH